MGANKEVKATARKFRIDEPVWVAGKIFAIHHNGNEVSYWVQCESGELKNEPSACLIHGHEICPDEPAKKPAKKKGARR